jgi:hypothetical protein
MASESEAPVGLPLKLGYAAALSAHFLLMLVILSITFYFVFWLGVMAFASLAEHFSPGSLETPLSGLGPMLEAAFATVILHVAVLGFLTYRRLRFAKFFLVLISVGTLSLVAAYYIDLAAVLHFKGWYPAGSNPKPEYPVLVITPGEQPGLHQAHVMQWSELTQFCRENPGYSFLVPAGEESALESQLPRHDLVWVIQHQQENASGPMSARFEVTRLANGRQKLVVDGSWYRNSNASVRGWYEAEAHAIYPKYFNEGDTYGIYLRDTLLLVAALNLAWLSIYLRRRWKKGWRPFHPPLESEPQLLGT